MDLERYGPEMIDITGTPIGVPIAYDIEVLGALGCLQISPGSAVLPHGEPPGAVAVNSKKLEIRTATRHPPTDPPTVPPPNVHRGVDFNIIYRPVRAMLGGLSLIHI